MASPVCLPRVGDTVELLSEPHNCKDMFTGHGPVDKARGSTSSSLSPVFDIFTKRPWTEVTGKRGNRGAGCGVEVSCMFRLFGKKAYIERTKCTL